MRALLALPLVALLACAPEPETPARQARPLHVPASTAAPEPARPLPVVVATSPEAAPSSCPDRAARLAHAQETIRAWHERVKVIAPLARFVEAHRCELRDTTGTVLVTRTREAGGVRVGVKRGSPHEIVCDVPEAQFPPGLDVDAMTEIAWLADTDAGTRLVDFGPGCRDAVLEVSFGDVTKQKRILALE